MIYTSESIEKAIEAFSSLPSIGRKTAARLVFHFLRQPEEYSVFFVDAIKDLKKYVKLCITCYNYTDQEICPICSSHKRTQNVICVVAEPNEVNSIEKTNEFFGLYHVLHGVINPLDGINPEDIRIKELIARLSGVEEVILALNPSVEGEVTAQYIAKMIKPLDIKISRIASGIPIGSSLEFSDEATLSRAMSGRITI